MKSFLEEIAEHLVKNHSVKELKDIAIILPSKRAGLHLKTALSQLIQKTFWAPKIITLDDFIVDQHPMDPVNSIAVHFELYHCYRQIFEEPGNFDSFHNWSSQVLNDFNEIDRYLIPKEEIFKNLKDIKEIESWSFNNDELSEGQIKFMEFWENLGALYDKFYDHLASKNSSTKGKIYRDIASSPEKYLNHLSYKKIYLIGFNALSKSEQIIFNYLEKLGTAEIFWDLDKYYIDNPYHEAGNFIRKQADLKNFEEIPNNLATKKNITFYPANSNLEQVNVCSQLLDKNFNQSKSAVILADEGLLSPLLNSLPAGIEEMNITMGYPISNSLALELLLLLFDIQINAKRFKSSHNKNAIYHKDFFVFLENPLIVKFLNLRGVSSLQLENDLTKYNLAFVKKSDIKELLTKAPIIADILFPDSSLKIATTIDKFISFFSEIRSELLKIEFERIEIEALYTIISSLKSVDQYNSDYPYIETIEGLKKLFLVFIKNEKLPFYGEPLKGMQIMGLLESRAIDFDNIIILSCNEKFLPGPHIQNSFIPQDLKQYLGLPTKQDRESIFAYYFYRLIHRTKNIHCIYNNGLPNGLDSNEISRYLIQLKNEYPHPINTKHINFNWTNTRTSTIIEKDKDTLKKIDFLFEKGLSPSALNKYLSCPLDFYHKYVLRIREKNELEEQIESNTQGDIIHQVLEDLYRAQMPNITSSKIDWMLGEFEALTEKEFQKRFPSGSYKFGKNLLHYKMALHSIKLYLNTEKKTIQKDGPFEILELETEITTELQIETPDGKKTVVLKGKADRIDQHNGQLRIIDYKSGYTKSSDVTVSGLSNITKSIKATQLMFYAYLYNKKYPNTFPVSGIASMKNMNAGLLAFTLKEERKKVDITQDTYDEFEEILTGIIQEIYTSEIPFTHENEAKYCMMCN